jgi:hypothetical protein
MKVVILGGGKVTRLREDSELRVHLRSIKLVLYDDREESPSHGSLMGLSSALTTTHWRSSRLASGMASKE